MRRVGISVRLRKGIQNPGQPAIIAHHNIRILIEGEERRQSGGTLAHCAPHQQTALSVHIVAERQLGQVAAVKGNQSAAHESAQLNAATALIVGSVVVVPLRVVELLLPRLDINVGVRHFAKVYLRPRYIQSGHSTLHWHIT